MSKFMNAVQAFIDAIRGQKGWVEELNDHSQNIARHFEGVSRAEADDALERFAALLPEAPLVALGLVAINCGSLVEHGGDPSIAGPGLLNWLPRVCETAGDFYQRCRALALADAELIAGLRAEMPDDEGEEQGASEGASGGAPSPERIVDEHIANEGWQRLANRFGPALFKEQPASVLGHMSEEFFRLGLIANLSRSKSLRQAARVRPELLEHTMRLDDLGECHRSFLATMLHVLDNELLLVVHVGQKKGFEVRISGIADNFQLHTLLAAALIGAPAKGWLTGEAPSQRAAAQCRDVPVDQRGGENVTGAFNLCNWTALLPDGTLSEGHGQDTSAHWIWNEGWPAEIAAFEGRRIVLLGAPPYPRHWRAGRQFHGMSGELTVERTLPAAEVNDWLRKFAKAPKG